VRRSRPDPIYPDGGRGKHQTIEVDADFSLKPDRHLIPYAPKHALAWRGGILAGDRKVCIDVQAGHSGREIEALE
jgi:hypothetical protein